MSFREIALKYVQKRSIGANEVIKRSIGRNYYLQGRGATIYTDHIQMLAGHLIISNRHIDMLDYELLIKFWIDL